jgi:hypothetical protein
MLHEVLAYFLGVPGDRELLGKRELKSLFVHGDEPFAPKRRYTLSQDGLKPVTGSLQPESAAVLKSDGLQCRTCLARRVPTAAARLIHALFGLTGSGDRKVSDPVVPATPIVERRSTRRRLLGK